MASAPRSNSANPCQDLDLRRLASSLSPYFPQLQTFPHLSPRVVSLYQPKAMFSQPSPLMAGPSPALQIQLLENLLTNASALSLSPCPQYFFYQSHFLQEQPILKSQLHQLLVSKAYTCHGQSRSQRNTQVTAIPCPQDSPL